MSDRVTRTVDLSEKAFDAYQWSCQVEGMSQKELASRLFEWFSRLDRSGRQMVLGTLPTEYAEDAAKQLANRCVELTRERDETGVIATITPARTSDRSPGRKKQTGRVARKKPKDNGGES